MAVVGTTDLAVAAEAVEWATVAVVSSVLVRIRFW